MVGAMTEERNRGESTQIPGECVSSEQDHMDIHHPHRTQNTFGRVLDLEGIRSYPSVKQKANFPIAFSPFTSVGNSRAGGESSSRTA